MKDHILEQKTDKLLSIVENKNKCSKWSDDCKECPLEDTAIKYSKLQYPNPSDICKEKAKDILVGVTKEKEQKLKVFVTTVESFNECYVQTILIVAETKERAKELIYAWRKDDHNVNYVSFKKSIDEIPFISQLGKEGVYDIWFGRNDDD